MRNWRACLCGMRTRLLAGAIKITHRFVKDDAVAAAGAPVTWSERWQSRVAAVRWR